MYSKKVQSLEPGLIVFVLDDSGSMGEPLPGTSDPKHTWVDRYVGAILRELLARSTEMKGEAIVVKPRFYVTFITYGSTVQTWPRDAREPLTIEAAMTMYAGGSDGTSGLGLNGGQGGTDALQAFESAREVVRGALLDEKFKQSFPPMVFHLTDGQSATDATDLSTELRSLSSTDGNVLVVNALLGTTTSLLYTSPADFPGYLSADEAGPDAYSTRLFMMSSRAPDTIRDNLVGDEIFPRFRSGASLYFDVRTKDMLKNVIQSVGSVGSR
jgi:hypothetical protein